jgi:hypothetical protein
MYRPFLAALAFGGLGVVIAACGHKSTTADADGEVHDLGYALFQVQVPKHQSFVVNVEIAGATQGETYLLLASDHAPENVGWFDAAARPAGCAVGDLRTRAELRSECELGGEGYLVDAQSGAQPISLQHGVGDVLTCDGDEPCTWYYAVVAAPRLASPRHAHVVVETGSDEGDVTPPKIRQLD